MTTTPARVPRSANVTDPAPRPSSRPASRSLSRTAPAIGRPPLDGSASPGTPREARRARSSRTTRTRPGGTALLAGVVIGFVCLCLLVSHLTRFYAYDEATYLSQVYPGPDLPFTAPRARGLTWLLAPMGAIGAPLPAVRAYLLMLNAGLMFIGFRAWLPVIGRRAVLAAAAFALCWPAMFEATEVFPNLPAALCAVAAAGYLARSALPQAGVALGLVALIRPMEATFLTAGLALGALLLPVQTTWGTPGTSSATTGRRLGALLTGLLIGWVPWLAEAQIRFGGPAQRLRSATQNVSGGLHPGNLIDHLMLTDGPISGITAGPVPLAGVLWWLVLASGALISTGLALSGRLTARRGGGAVAGLAGAATAVQYLLLAGVIEARFLLPAYALLTVSLCSLLPSPRATTGTARAGATLVTVVALGVVAGFGAWQVHEVTRIERQQDADRQISRVLSNVVSAQAGGRPCIVAAQAAFPVIGFASGCRSARLDPLSPVLHLAEDPGTAPIYGLSATDPRTGLLQPVAGSARRLRGDGARSWWLFAIPPSAVVITT